MSKNPQGKVDEFRSLMSSDRDAEFLRLANLPNQNITTLHRWLVEEGYKGSYQSVCTWHSNFSKAGAKAAAFNTLSQDYNGVVPELALQKVIAMFSHQMDTAIEQLSGIQPEEIGVTEYFRQLPHLAREIRSCAGIINQMRFVGDRKNAELSGCYRISAELKEIFKDSPFSSALEEALKSALIKIEEEL